MEHLRAIRFKDIKEVNDLLTSSIIRQVKEIKDFKIDGRKLLLTTERKEGFSTAFNKLVKLEEGRDISELEVLDAETNNPGYLLEPKECEFFLLKVLNFLGEFTVRDSGEVVYTELEGSTVAIEDELRELVEMAVYVDQFEYLAVIAEKLGMLVIAEEARNMAE